MLFTVVHAHKSVLIFKYMKSVLFLSLFVLLCSCKSQTLSSVMDVVGQQVSVAAAPTSDEISRGLKEALSLSIEKGARSLHKKNAYFKNEAIKILLPSEAKKVITTLNKIGLGALTDELTLRLNRAAEDAAIKSIPIFKDAIFSLNFTDAMKILTSSNAGAATDFLRQRTSTQLSNLYKENINSSLRKVGADVAWNKVFSTYNKIPGLKSVNPDLSEYATQKALQGLFLIVSKRESLVRSDLSERTSPLLKRVFGYGDRFKR